MWLAIVVLSLALCWIESHLNCCSECSHLLAQFLTLWATSPRRVWAPTQRLRADLLCQSSLLGTSVFRTRISDWDPINHLYFREQYDRRIATNWHYSYGRTRTHCETYLLFASASHEAKSCASNSALYGTSATNLGVQALSSIACTFPCRQSPKKIAAAHEFGVGRPIQKPTDLSQ